jgi:hypothetical protein
MFVCTPPRAVATFGFGRVRPSDAAIGGEFPIYGGVAMRELSQEEVDSVHGGILQAIVFAWGVYGVANEVYEFSRGFQDGFVTHAN